MTATGEISPGSARILICPTFCGILPCCSHFSFTLLFTLYFYPAVHLLFLRSCSHFIFTLLFTLYFYAALHTLLLTCCSHFIFTLLFTLYFYAALHSLLLTCCSHFIFNLLFTFYLLIVTSLSSVFYRWTIVALPNRHIFYPLVSRAAT